MKKNVLFIQGGGEKGYETDSKLAASLQQHLGESYNVRYPIIQTDISLPDFGWPLQIEEEITSIRGEVILVAHSLGASMLLKYLSENKVQKKIAGIFLISTPFWSGAEDWVQGLKLKEDFANSLPRNILIFLYHCQDDKEIPISHLKVYKQELPSAVIREIKSGGHQLNNDLRTIAEDIKLL